MYQYQLMRKMKTRLYISDNVYSIKMVYYKPVKVIINTLGLRKIIINLVVHPHGIPKLIITDWGLLFRSKFWSLLCYFLGIKKRLSPAFYLQTDSQTQRQNITIEAYFKAFLNWKQNNSAKLLASLQTRANYQIENIQYILYITARVRHHQEKVSELK